MRTTLLYFLVALFALPSVVKAQYVVDGSPMDSITYRFANGPLPGYITDTATTPLWQLGYTHKAFFTTVTDSTRGLMTDTLNNYPTNADNSFTIKIANHYNIIIGFWHRYQTDSAHDGGIVEFSLDSVNWQNLKGVCNIDSTPGWTGMGIKTDNFYTFNDTLPQGTPAFSGSSNGEQYSRFQLLGPIPVKGTAGPLCNLTQWSHPTIYIRFRFVSDTTADTLAGWMIDSVKVEHDQYQGGAVAKVTEGNTLPIMPNPSATGNFILPALEHEDSYTIEVYNAMGQCVLRSTYSSTLNMGFAARGLYFYHVTNGQDSYSGKLLYE